MNRFKFSQKLFLTLTLLTSINFAFAMEQKKRSAKDADLPGVKESIKETTGKDKKKKTKNSGEHWQEEGPQGKDAIGTGSSSTASTQKPFPVNEPDPLKLFSSKTNPAPITIHNPNTNDFDQLPDEILKQILTNPNLSLNDLINLKNTCNRFKYFFNQRKIGKKHFLGCPIPFTTVYEISNPISLDLSNDKDLTDQKLINFINQFKASIVSINIGRNYNITGKSIRYLAQNCPNLSEFTLNHNFEVKIEDLIFLTQKCKFIRKLNLNEWKYNFRCNLPYFDINHINGPSHERHLKLFIKLLNNCPELVELNFGFYKYLSNETCEILAKTFATKCPKLTTIYTPLCDYSTMQALNKIHDLNPRIEILTLKDK